MLPNYTAAGAEAMVISGVASHAEVSVFERAIGAVRWVRLTADRADLRRRLAQRDGPAVMLSEVDRYADELDASTFAELVIPTSGSTPSAIANQLEGVEPLSGYLSSGPYGGQPDRAPGPSRPDDSDAQVLVITGPRVVGTSTIGWELFSRCAAHEPTAFVDLGQVGFLNTGSDVHARHHQLRAANLAAMVKIYRQKGCRLIIAVGTVLTADDPGRYLAICDQPGHTRRSVRNRRCGASTPRL